MLLAVYLNSKLTIETVEQGVKYVNSKDDRTTPMELTIKLTIKTAKHGQIQATQTFSLQYTGQWQCCPVIFGNLFFPNLKRLLQNVLWEHFYGNFQGSSKALLFDKNLPYWNFYQYKSAPFKYFSHFTQMSIFFHLCGLYVDRNINVSYSTFYIILEINLFCILLAAFCI